MLPNGNKYLDPLKNLVKKFWKSKIINNLSLFYYTEIIFILKFLIITFFFFYKKKGKIKLLIK